MEQKIQNLIDSNVNLVVPWYLMLSYGYYILNETIVSDTFFDNLSKIFLNNFNEIKHRHKALISEDDLKAGTLYYLRENDYPLLVRSAYNQVVYKKGEDL